MLQGFLATLVRWFFFVAILLQRQKGIRTHWCDSLKGNTFNLIVIELKVGEFCFAEFSDDAPSLMLFMVLEMNERTIKLVSGRVNRGKRIRRSFGVWFWMTHLQTANILKAFWSLLPRFLNFDFLLVGGNDNPSCQYEWGKRHENGSSIGRLWWPVSYFMYAILFLYGIDKQKFNMEGISCGILLNEMYRRSGDILKEIWGSNCGIFEILMICLGYELWFYMDRIQYCMLSDILIIVWLFEMKRIEIWRFWFDRIKSLIYIQEHSSTKRTSCIKTKEYESNTITTLFKKSINNHYQMKNWNRPHPLHCRLATWRSPSHHKYWLQSFHYKIWTIETENT